MQNYWEREFAITKTIVVAIYVSVVIYVALVSFNIPPVPYQWEQTQNIIFIALLIAAVATLSISTLIAKYILGSKKLSKIFSASADKTQGLKSVLSLARIGAIIMSAMGEAIGIYGLVLYLLSGDSVRPWIFFILCIIHYTITMSVLRRVRFNIEQLSQLH